MTKLKLIFMGLCCMAAMGLTSCLGDDDDDKDTINTNDLFICKNAVKGFHTGRAVFLQTKDSTDNRSETNLVTDSVEIAWDVTPTDSVTRMTMAGVPLGRIAAPYIKDAELRKALLDRNYTAQMTCLLGFYDARPVSYVLGPSKATIENVEYGGGSHKLEFEFWGAYPYSYGYASNGQMEAQISLYNLYVDDQRNINLLNANAAELIHFFFRD